MASDVSKGRSGFLEEGLIHFLFERCDAQSKQGKFALHACFVQEQPRGTQVASFRLGGNWPLRSVDGAESAEKNPAIHPACRAANHPAARDPC
jgi:hypothetical protein